MSAKKRAPKDAPSEGGQIEPTVEEVSSSKHAVVVAAITAASGIAVAGITALATVLSSGSASPTVTPSGDGPAGSVSASSAVGRGLMDEVKPDASRRDFSPDLSITSVTVEPINQPKGEVRYTLKGTVRTTDRFVFSHILHGCLATVAVIAGERVSPPAQMSERMSAVTAQEYVADWTITWDRPEAEKKRTIRVVLLYDCQHNSDPSPNPLDGVSSRSDDVELPRTGG
ncbi:hypothetical protein ABT158_48540 [Nonomuraea sp. NPDC001636]|uniref:hypothetical protein n=1 Tax=Nonomuraea sp. NPDC001636 TaxID=3154391 RepID=UPI0033178E0F